MEEHKNPGRGHRPSVEPVRRPVSGRIRPRSHVTMPARASGPSPDETLKQDTPYHEEPAVQDLDFRPPTPKETRTRPVAKPAAPRTSRSFVLRRQIQEGAKRHKQKSRRVHRLHFVGYIAAAVVLTSLGAVLWSFQGVLPISLNFLENTAPSSQITQTESSEHANKLDETEVTARMVELHMAAADAPRVIRIPSLNVEARIKRVGVSLNAEPVAPNNIYDVGWFESAGSPGSDALSLLNGHSVGPTKSAVFNELHTIQVGSTIEIERGDGSKLMYVVEKVQSYTSAEIDINAAFRAADPGKQGLNLITTPIRYNLPTSPERRVIVFATLRATQ